MVPPDVGAVHQVNLEYLSRVVQVSDGLIYPDSVVGTDSHTTMINGLGILGWGTASSSRRFSAFRLNCIIGNWLHIVFSRRWRNRV